MKKEQQRVIEEMKERHRDEDSKLKINLESEARQAEIDEESRFNSEKSKRIFELQQRQAADLQARQDLNPAEMERVSTIWVGMQNSCPVGALNVARKSFLDFHESFVDRMGSVEAARK